MEKENLIPLVEQAQAGDKQAMTDLLCHAHTAVSYQCRKIMEHPEDAEDMVQETLIKIYQNLNRLKEPGKFNSWANRIAAHLCINQRKRNPKDLQFLEDEEGRSVLDLMEDTDQQTVPESVVDNAETQKMLTDLIDALPDPQRVVTYLFYFDEMSVKEIAQLMEVSESTIKSRLNYARKAIKTGVLDYEKQGLRLYGASPLPLLFYFLQKDMMGHADLAAASTQVQALLSAQGAAAGAATAAAGSAAAKSTAAGTLGQSAGAAAKGIPHLKIGAALLAGAVTVGGIAFLWNRPEVPAEPSPPVVSEPVLVETVPYTSVVTTVDTGVSHVQISLVTPLFEEPEGNCQALNETFQQLRQSYEDGTDPNVSFLLSHLGELPAPVTLKEVYTVQGQDTDSVHISYHFSWDCDQPGWVTTHLSGDSLPEAPLVFSKLTGALMNRDLTAYNEAFQGELLEKYGTASLEEIVRLPHYGKNHMVYYRPQFGIWASQSAS